MFRCSLLVLFCKFLLSSGHSSDAQPKSFLSHVAVRRLTDGLTCSGVILSASYVLTSGKCVENLEEDGVSRGLAPESLEVGVGSKNRTAGSRFKVVFMYHSFLEEHYRDQIAVLELEKRIAFSKSVLPITLATKRVQPYASLKVLGWGRDDQFVKLQLTTGLSLTKVDCYQKIGIYSDKFICLNYNFGSSTSACVSDFGSPVLDMQNNLVGLGPIEIGDCAAVEGFIRIFDHLDWLNSFCLKDRTYG